MQPPNSGRHNPAGKSEKGGQLWTGGGSATNRCIVAAAVIGGGQICPQQTRTGTNKPGPISFNIGAKAVVSIDGRLAKRSTAISISNSPAMDSQACTLICKNGPDVELAHQRSVDCT